MTWKVSGTLICVFLTGFGSAGEPISPAKFEVLHALCKPGKVDSAWNEIPWLTSLWQARLEAARQGKPLFLWQMDGNPLACV